MTNIKQNVSVLAIAAMVATAPMAAFAQSASGESDTTSMEKPVEDAQANAEVPMTDDTSASETAEAPVVTDEPTEDVAAVEGEFSTERPVEGQIVMQSEDTILANDLIGTDVYSTNGESIGTIDDLIVNLDGSVEGAVISVGGFLGIGDKWVAVEMASLQTTTDEDGDVRLVSSATEEELEAAESFVTADAQELARRVSEQQREQQAQDGRIVNPPISN